MPIANLHMTLHFIGNVFFEEMDCMRAQASEVEASGFSLRIGDRLFDGSIATRLRELKHEFENNPYVKQI